MKNTNIFNCDGLKLDGDDYLYHKEIPNFSTKNTFTVECSFYITEMKENKDYILYEQFINKTEMMGLYICSQYLCFFLRGHRIKVALNQPMKINIPYNVTAVNDEDRIRIYIDGISIDYEEERYEFDSSYDDGVPGETFRIGEKFEGVITHLQIYPEATEPNIIRKRAVVAEEEPGNAVLFMDFSNNEYKDISKSKMPILSVGAPEVSNYTYCTKLDGNSYFVLSSDLKIDQEYFSCYKMYPLAFNAQEHGLLSAYYEQSNKVFYEILSEKATDGKYYITLRLENKIIKTQTQIKTRQWHDFALSWDQRELVLYYDGVKIIEEHAIACPVNIEVSTWVGKTSNVNERSLIGYLSYIAEFDKSKKFKEIMSYIENPPFLYDPNIKSLAFFIYDTPMELLNKRSLIACGKSEFGLYTNKIDGTPSKRFIIRIPKEKDPDWDNLTSWEKLVYENMLELIQMVYRDCFKLPIRDNVKCEHIYKYMKMYHEDLYQKLYRGECVKSNDAKELAVFIKDIILSVKDFYPLLADGKIVETGVDPISWSVIGLIIFAAFVVSLFVSAVVMYEKEIRKFFDRFFQDIETLMKFLELLRRLEEESRRRKRPIVMLESMNVNHDSNPAIGSIHFKGEAPVMSNRFQAAQNINAVIIKSLLISFRINVQLRNSGNADFNGTIKIKSDVFADSFYVLEKRIPANTSINVTFQTKLAIRNDEPNFTYRRAEYTITYKPENSTDVTKDVGIITIYGIKGIPVSPWFFKEGQYDITKDYPNIEFFNYFIKAGVHAIVLNYDDFERAAINKNKYYLSQVNVYSGIIPVSGLQKIRFNLTAFLNLIKTNANLLLSSLDMSSLMYMFISANGWSGGVLKLRNNDGKTIEFYDTKTVFNENVHPLSCNEYFLFARSESPEVTIDTNVSDLYYLAKGGTDPKSSNLHDKSFNVKFSYGANPLVTYHTPFTVKCWRERTIVCSTHCDWDTNLYKVSHII